MKRFFSNIAKELDALEDSGWSLAKFGFLVGGILLLLGGLAYYHGKIETAAWVGIPGFILFALGATMPSSLRLAYRAWMSLALFLGAIIGPALLAAIYFVVVTPISIIMLFFKGDPLEKKTKQGSYWIPRAEKFETSSMERMF